MSCTTILDSHDGEQPSRQSLVKILEKAPGVPYLLPVHVPEGFHFKGPHGASLDQFGKVVSRESIFLPKGGASNFNPVKICTELYVSAERRLCGKNAEGETIERRHQEYVVQILTDQDDPITLKAWRAVQLTADLNEIYWLAD